MGLTIHYDYHASAIHSPAHARRLVTSLQQFAKTLPLQNVSDVMTWTHGQDDPLLRNHFTHYVPIERPGEDADIYWAKPRELAFFAIDHEGSETSAFGLGRFEPTAFAADEHTRAPSNIPGWRWQRFCKTQYASLTAQGGWDNFFRIHDGICQILRHAITLGMEVHVQDESTYWDHQDPEKLRVEVHRWNTMVAAVVGKFKDAAGRKSPVSEAPILESPDFEQLEAQGQHFLDQQPDVNRIHNPG